MKTTEYLSTNTALTTRLTVILGVLTIFDRHTNDQIGVVQQGPQTICVIYS